MFCSIVEYLVVQLAVNECFGYVGSSPTDRAKHLTLKFEVGLNPIYLEKQRELKLYKIKFGKITQLEEYRIVYPNVAGSNPVFLGPINI